MNTTREQIDQWRAVASEHQHLEFKEAKANFDFEKLCKYCVAIANEGGGHLLLGIADVPPRPVVGSKAFGNITIATERLYNTLGFRVDVEEVSHPDGRVVVFSVPSRPRGSAYNHNGAYFMRSGGQLVAMSEDHLRSIFAEGGPDWLEEPTLEGLRSEQVIDLLDTQTFFDLLELPYPIDQSGVLDRLERERLIDLKHGQYSIRRLGALVIAKRLTDFPDLMRKAPRVVVYDGVSKLHTRLEQTGGRGYAAGFQGFVGFIMAQLPRHETIEDALRRESTLVPEIAIRELVANALIHQDFHIHGASVMVEIYTNRIEISNPGDPIVPVERFIDGYQSRNERLADLMRRLHICEERGSGIDKVVHEAEHWQLPAPDFRALHNRSTATLFGPKEFEEMDREERIRACYQHCALKYVAAEYMTNQSLRERFNLPEGKSASVSQVIKATLDASQIKPDLGVGSSRKLARYLPFWA